MTSPPRRLVLALFGASLASGCVLAPVGPRYGYGRTQPYPQQGGAPPPEQPYEGEGPVVYAPPPPPRYEVVGVAPAVGLVWLAGYWLWGGGRYAWRPGYWERARPGHQWVPHAWVPSGRGWVHRPGYWRRG